jgi:DNA primase
MIARHRHALPAREALILVAVLNHPWLLENQAEELAHLEFRSAEADRLRRALLDASAQHPKLDPAILRAELESRGFAEVLRRVDAAVTHASDWPARPGAGAPDVACWWSHVVTLHRKARTLNKELKEAEQALGSEPSEENLQWLRDVQERLSALDGAEALIEGFGASSGRPVRTF